MDAKNAEMLRLRAVGMHVYTAPAARVPAAAAIAGPSGPVWPPPFVLAGRTTDVGEWTPCSDVPTGSFDAWTPSLHRLWIALEDPRHLRASLDERPPHSPPELAVGWDHSLLFEGRPWGMILYRCRVEARWLDQGGTVELLLKTLGHPAHGQRHVDVLGQL